MDSDTDGEPTSPLQDASNRAAVAIMSMEEIKVSTVLINVIVSDIYLA